MIINFEKSGMVYFLIIYYINFTPGVRCYVELQHNYQAKNILVLFPLSFFSMRFVSVQMVDPYFSKDTVTEWKKFSFILPDRSDFHMINNRSIAVHAFTRHMLTSPLVDEIFLPRFVNWSNNFRGLSLRVEMTPPCLKHINFVLFAFT